MTEQRPTPLAGAPEKFLTLKAAASALGVPEFKMRRAVQRGQFPAYRFGNTRGPDENV